MPRNTDALLPHFVTLLKELKLMSSETHKPIEAAFVRWYVQNKYPGADASGRVSYTDQANDGEIDAIVKNPSNRWIVIQSKYNTGYTKKNRRSGQLEPEVGRIPEDDYTKFDRTTIPAIASGSQQKFNEWIRLENIPRLLTSQYEKVFQAFKQNPENVHFVLITTYDPPSTNQKEIISDLDFVDINRICNLERDRKEKTLPHADDMLVTLLGRAPNLHQIIVNDPQYDIQSRIVRIGVSELIDYMHGLQDPLSIVSKNVRVALPKKGGKISINEGILETYEKEPEQFWYSHNGITILCDRINEKKDGKELLLQNPNVVNGAQTILTLEKTQKNNPSATMLARIFEIEQDDKKTKELIFNMIIRTNKQNPILWRDLRSNEPVLKEIDTYFEQRRVFFERRRGEKNLIQARIARTASTLETDPTILGQIITISENGEKGPVLAKQRGKEEMFEDEDLFKEIFKNVPKDKMFFQFVIGKLVVDKIINKTRKFKRLKKKGYLVATINAIFWDVFRRMSDTKYNKLKNIANRELTLYSCDKDFRMNPELTPLSDVVDYIVKVATPISRKYDYTAKSLYKAFIDLDKANEELFEKCLSDRGKSLKGSGRRKLKNAKNMTPKTFSSNGVYEDIEKIFWDYLSNWVECNNPSCRKLTNSLKIDSEGCMHCHHGPCPRCNRLTSFEEEQCTHCDQEIQ